MIFPFSQYRRKQKETFRNITSNTQAWSKSKLCLTTILFQLFFLSLSKKVVNQRQFREDSRTLDLWIVDVDRNYRKEKREERLKRQQILFPKKSQRKAYVKGLQDLSRCTLPQTSTKITENNSKFRLEIYSASLHASSVSRCGRKKGKRKVYRAYPRIFTTASGDRSFTLISGWIYRWSANDWVSATKPNLDRGGPFVVPDPFEGPNAITSLRWAPLRVGGASLFLLSLSSLSLSFSLSFSLFLFLSWKKKEGTRLCEYCQPTNIESYFTNNL